MTKPFALIVEDNEHLAMLFTMALQQAQFETEIIQNGKAAQNRLKEITPNMVILDLHLPLVSGDKLLRQIRSDRRLDNTKVLLTTADGLMAEQLRDEADLVLLKPIDFEQLRQLASRFVPTMV